MGRPRFSKLSALVAAVTFGVAGASVVAQASTTTLNWGQVNTAQSPPGREFGSMTFDSVRNRTVLFGGGTAAFTNLNDTWEFDGANWLQRTPSTSAPALVAAAMAFDINRKVSVLFGGGTSSFGFSSDTWEWDGTNWVLRTLATAPPARLWTQMAYDSTRGRIVLFGGAGPASKEFGDTWEYDGSAWTQKTSVNIPPSDRFLAGMAFDPGLGRIVLFGGHSAGQRMADTWQWDGTNWTQFFPTSTPFVRFSHSMAYDPQVGHTVVFGGDHFEPYALGPTNDTWQWDGAQWTQDWTSATPIARADQSMALDANGRLVLFGGGNELNPPTLYTDTSELGTGITTPPGSPAGALNPASADFGSVAVGSTSYVIAVTLFNDGTGPLLINSMSIIGDFAVSSTYCPIAPNPLAAGMVCRALLTFTPTAAGDRLGSLVFSDNGPGGSQSVPLHGVGVGGDFSISASPGSLSVVQGSSATSSISTAAIGAGGTIALSASVSPAGLTATLSPTSVSAGGSSTLAVSAAYTTASGSYTVTVTGTEGSKTHSTLVAVTVTLKGIVNGGFETGDFTGWIVTGKTAIVKTSHTGKFAARVGSTSPSTTSTLAQTFSVPAAGGKLSFWYRMTCPDTLSNDWFTVTLHDNATGATSTLQPRVCSTRRTWTRVSVNVASHAGHSVTVTFLNHDDNQAGDETFTLVDDVSLT